METTYFYVDESFQQKQGHWHCNIGGMLLGSAQAVDVEIALETDLLQRAKSAGVSTPVSECKYSNFLRGTPDDFKLDVCKSVASLLLQHKARFLVSHAKCRSSQLGLFKGLTPSLAIQQLAHFNVVSSYLAKITDQEIVQVIVDLGLSEAFRPVYNVYAGAIQSVPNLVAQGIGDDQITIPNFRRLPAPVFMDSARSRVLQFSDLLIGLLLSRELNALTSFKQSLLQAFEPLLGVTTFHSVEWNANVA